MICRRAIFKKHKIMPEFMNVLATNLFLPCDTLAIASVLDPAVGLLRDKYSFAVFVKRVISLQRILLYVISIGLQITARARLSTS